MEAVIKVGGSLAEDASALKVLCMELGSLARCHRLLIVPGGGKFADTVRELDREFRLPASASHMMAILAMDQFGLLLQSLTPNSKAVTGLNAAERLSQAEKLPILLPSRLMTRRNPLEHSWDVTSDTIAAYIAGLLNTGKLILVKDVDGVFTEDPKVNKDARLIETLRVEGLLSLDKRTCLDKHLPMFLQGKLLECYVVNGKFPERLGKILRGERVVGTRIFI